MHVCKKRLNEDAYLRTELSQAARVMGQQAGITSLAILLRMAESTIDPIGAYLLTAFVEGVAETAEMRERLRAVVPLVARELVRELRGSEWTRN